MDCVRAWLVCSSNIIISYCFSIFFAGAHFPTHAPRTQAPTHCQHNWLSRLCVAEVGTFIGVIVLVTIHRVQKPTESSKNALAF